MSTYPDNTGWTGHYKGFDIEAEGECFAMAIRFAHADGRVITADINTNLGGEVVDHHGERLPGSEDAFPSMVDSAYEAWFNQPGPVLVEPEDLDRNYWIYDTYVMYGAGPSSDQLSFATEPEESDEFLVDLDYHGPFAKLPIKAVDTVLIAQAERHIARTLQFEDLEKIYATIIDLSQTGVLM